MDVFPQQPQLIATSVQSPISISIYQAATASSDFDL